MIGDRLLKYARNAYGDDTAKQTFEPLVADFQREHATSSRRGLLRLQWLAAIAQTCVWCLPRAFGVRMPAILFFEVACCVIFFPLAALAMQWREISMQSGYFGWRLVASLTFTVIPVVWRFRVAAIDPHRRQALTRSHVLVILAAVLGLGYEQWPTRVAQAAGILWLAIAGWRLGAWQQFGNGWNGTLLKLAGVGGALFVATWPVTLSLGIDRQSLYWQQQQLLSYVMAFMTVVTLKNRFNGFTSIQP
jgi:hypothetical protein